MPAGATGSVVTVSTAGGTATLELADLVNLTVAAEPQGSDGSDRVGGTIATAYGLTLGPNSLLTVNGRLDTGPEVDLYHLVNAETGGMLSVWLTTSPSSPQLRLFDETGSELKGVVSSLSRYVLPAASEYYLGYSGSPNSSYNVVDGSGAVNIWYPGDYTLSVQYAAPGVTSLNSINALAASGIPTVSTIASANTGQTITISGEGFDSTTRVRFVSFSSWSPQNLLGEVEVVPTSVVGDGTSLDVVVPREAVTGPVRLVDEPGGLILQIVPTLSDIDLTSTWFGDGANLRLTGSGFIEGAQTLILGTGGGAVEVQDLWDFTVPDAYYAWL